MTLSALIEYSHQLNYLIGYQLGFSYSSEDNIFEINFYQNGNRFLSFEMINMTEEETCLHFLNEKEFDLTYSFKLEEYNLLELDSFINNVEINKKQIEPLIKRIKIFRYLNEISDPDSYLTKFTDLLERVKELVKLLPEGYMLWFSCGSNFSDVRSDISKYKSETDSYWSVGCVENRWKYTSKMDCHTRIMNCIEQTEELLKNLK
jgi:hypothetical protein